VKTIRMSIAVLLLVMTLVSCSASKVPVPDEEDTEAESNTEVKSDTEISSAAVRGVVYNLKINPEFEIKADDSLIVTEVAAKNDDAEGVLAAVNVIGRSVTEAFELLTDEAKNQGFLTDEKGNTVNIIILEKDDEKFPTCSVCGGCGTVVCKDCHGTGIACLCDWCKGSGVKPDEGGDDSWECWLCHGTGICPECGGTGQIVVTNGEDGGIVYAEPGVPEMGMCSICWGTGGCDNCHGSSVAVSDPDDGDNTCEGCSGVGYLHCSDDLNGYSWCPCCWGSGVEGTGDPDYQSYYTPSEKYETEEWIAILKN